MKKFYKQFVLYILAFAMLVSFCGCYVQTPPGIADTEERFVVCYDYIMILVEYLISMEYAEAEIDCTYTLGKISVRDGTKYKEIKMDATIKDAVKHLRKEYEYISKSGNTIIFCQWKRFNDTSCGIAYSINGVSEPEVQYAVKLEPLNQMGWYYYVMDFNLWRTQTNY